MYVVNHCSALISICVCLLRIINQCITCQPQTSLFVNLCHARMTISTWICGTCLQSQSKRNDLLTFGCKADPMREICWCLFTLHFKNEIKIQWASNEMYHFIEQHLLKSITIKLIFFGYRWDILLLTKHITMVATSTCQKKEKNAVKSLNKNQESQKQLSSWNHCTKHTKWSEKHAKWIAQFHNPSLKLN